MLIVELKMECRRCVEELIYYFKTLNETFLVEESFFKVLQITKR